MTTKRRPFLFPEFTPHRNLNAAYRQHFSQLFFKNSPHNESLLVFSYISKHPDFDPFIDKAARFEGGRVSDEKLIKKYYQCVRLIDAETAGVQLANIPDPSCILPAGT